MRCVCDAIRNARRWFIPLLVARNALLTWSASDLEACSQSRSLSFCAEKLRGQIVGRNNIIQCWRLLFPVTMVTRWETYLCLLDKASNLQGVILGVGHEYTASDDLQVLSWDTRAGQKAHLEHTGPTTSPHISLPRMYVICTHQLKSNREKHIYRSTPNPDAHTVPPTGLLTHHAQVLFVICPCIAYIQTLSSATTIVG